MGSTESKQIVEEKYSGDEDDVISDLKRYTLADVPTLVALVCLGACGLRFDRGGVKDGLCFDHGGVKDGLCFDLGGVKDGVSGVSLRYIRKNLWLSNDEMDRLRDRNSKSLLRGRKLRLVLDLDHTLLHSTRHADVAAEERYLNCERDNAKSSLFRVKGMSMMTKLRPYVHTFLKEASKLFEMYIYTMGQRRYALEMAKLLDPENIYFNSRIITRDDCTQEGQKSLDVVLAKESATVILDDTEEVWSQKHKENLILMEKYHFFDSSCNEIGFNSKSFSQRRSDESETKGALPNILKILQRIHSLFFDQGQNDSSLEERDVRQVVKRVRSKVLNNCKIVFSRGLLLPHDLHSPWGMAEKLGAKCCVEVDSSVTHVVATHAQNDEESLWAVKEKKFLVSPSWILACNYMWRKMPEEEFLIPLHQH